MKQFIVSEREIELLYDALDNTIDNLEYYINEDHDEASIQADREKQEAYFKILDKLSKGKEQKNPAEKSLDNPYVDNPDFLEIL